jgi:hypothetical protein
MMKISIKSISKRTPYNLAHDQFLKELEKLRGIFTTIAAFPILLRLKSGDKYCFLYF